VALNEVYDDGLFPFGQPNSVRPLRHAATGPAQVLLIGVYPSAFHVRWTAPKRLGGGVAGGLPVDVEPVVFWAGDDDGGAARLARWKETVGFLDGDGPGAHGKVTALSGGPMGKVLAARYLACLDLTADDCAFTDVHPVYLVHRNGRTGEGRGGGDAIDQEYNDHVAELGKQPSHIPTRRTSVPDFVRAASTRFRPRIVADVEEANAPVVVTLGDEAMQVLLTIDELEPNAPASTLPELKAAGLYGSSCELTVNDRRVRWMPLAHPNALGFGSRPATGTASGAEPPPHETSPAADADLSWSEVHDRWCEQMRRERGTDT
jgi:hypothetical protein